MTKDNHAKPEQKVEAGTDGPTEHAAAQNVIKTATENELQQRLKERDSLKAFRFTRDPANSFCIDMGDGSEARDKRTLQTLSQAIADGLSADKVNNSEKQAHLDHEKTLDPRALKQIFDGDFESSDGKRFKTAIEQGVDSIPSYVQHYLHQGGWRFKLDESIYKNDPALADQRASGHAEGDGKFGTNFGATDFSNHQIVVAEKAKPLSQNDHTYEADRVNPHPEQTLRHETGHALDAAMGNFSQTQEFLTAYANAVNALSPDERKQLAYYLQPGVHGPQEVFAELFAYLHGGGPNAGPKDNLLAKKFGNCLNEIVTKETQMKKAYA